MARKAKKATKKSVKKSKVAKKKAPVRKAAARKAPARKAKRVAKKAVKKAAKKAPKKLVKAKAKASASKGEYGEGNYKASKKFLGDQAAFVKTQKKNIPAMAKAAEAALEGPRRSELLKAEQEARDHSVAGHEE